MKQVILLGAFLCACLGMHAQVKGIVLENDSPVVGVVVFYKGTQLGTVTNEEGLFSIGKPTKGGYLMIQGMGFKLDSILINPNEQTPFLKIQLIPDNQTTEILIEGNSGGTILHSKDPHALQVLTEKELCKAACCSLSESFETNGSVDASFTDGITGTRQIKMLGLDGKYTQILFDNMPAARGLAGTFGLSYLPGPWINTIALAKGAGSVMHGYEGVTGQINVAHKAGEMKEKLFVNAYESTMGRSELNVLTKYALKHAWEGQFQLHGANAQKVYDMNNDGFLDNPLFRNYLLRNAWQFTGNGGWRGQYDVSYGNFTNKSGQTNYITGASPNEVPWGSDSRTQHANVNAKTGYLFDEHGHKSFGSQISLGYHNQQALYGYRDYSGIQRSARINLLFSNEFIEGYKYTVGVSAESDAYEESLTTIGGVNALGNANLNRTEQVAGAFAEVDATPNEHWQIVAGVREDKNNIYGMLFTPRFHMRYSPNEKTSIKFSAGKAYRSPQVVVDHLSALGGNRIWNLMGSSTEYPFGFQMEEATNMGLVFIQKFKLFYREASFTADAFHTNFIHQLVADYETAGQFSMYNLSGKSFANAVQTDFTISPFKRSEIRLAYRWLDARTTYNGDLKERPLVAKQRVFMNLSYYTKANAKGQKLSFDFTARWLGKQRMAQQDVSLDNTIAKYSESYWTLNAQVSAFLRENLEIYIGGENLTGYTVTNPIFYADAPNQSYFDASQVYGPMFGANYYIGLRWRI